MMRKEQFMALLALAPLPASLAAKAKKTAPKPNVVLIVADDLGLGDVSSYGSKTIQTPNIDNLASQGVLFNNAYATSATSTPSRYAMFTGMYPWRSNMHILPGDAPLVIPTDMPTMPKMFQEQGYKTAAIGKWHLGMGEGETDWNQQITPAANTVGFDYTNVIPATVDRVPTVYIENGKVVGLDPEDPIKVNYEKPFPGEITGKEHPELLTMPLHHGHDGTIINGISRIGHMTGGQSALWDDATMASYFLEKAKSFVNDNCDKPFFLYYGLHEPHVPRTAMEKFRGATKYGVRGDVIVEADWLVGQIVGLLESKGLMDNTIIIFTSDNGGVVQDGYLDGSDECQGDHDFNGGLRGGKYSLYDGGMHVPMMLCWKGQVKPCVSDAYVCQMDWFASFAKLLGTKVPKGLDSNNTLKAFLGKSSRGRRSQLIEATRKIGLRLGDFVLMPPYDGPFTNETGHDLGNRKEYGLFNIRKDPHQDNNLVESKPWKFRRLRRIFLKEAGECYNPHKEQETLK